VQARPQRDVDIGVFYNALAPYGQWINHRTYGKVWFPNGIDKHWRPYTDGYWANTEEYGWLWVANEVWGWAPYHYGRWAWDKWYGWIWIPGRTWAPAWVVWRSGDGYAAWAPMPPNAVWQPNVGLNTRYVNYDRDIFYGAWVTVRESDLPARYLSSYILAPQQSVNIFYNTVFIFNSFTVVNHNIVNHGVPVRRIEHVTGHKLPPVKPNVSYDVDPPRSHHGHHEPVPTVVRPKPIEQPTQKDVEQELELAKKLNTEPPPVGPTLARTEPKVAGRLNGEPEPLPVPSSTHQTTDGAANSLVPLPMPISTYPGAGNPHAPIEHSSNMPSSGPATANSAVVQPPVIEPNTVVPTVSDPTSPANPAVIQSPATEPNRVSPVTDPLPPNINTPVPVDNLQPTLPVVPPPNSVHSEPQPATSPMAVDSNIAAHASGLPSSNLNESAPITTIQPTQSAQPMDTRTVGQTDINPVQNIQQPATNNSPVEPGNSLPPDAPASTMGMPQPGETAGRFDNQPSGQVPATDIAPAPQQQVIPEAAQNYQLQPAQAPVDQIQQAPAMQSAPEVTIQPQPEQISSPPIQEPVYQAPEPTMQPAQAPVEQIQQAPAMQSAPEVTMQSQPEPMSSPPVQEPVYQAPPQLEPMQSAPEPAFQAPPEPVSQPMQQSQPEPAPMPVAAPEPPPPPAPEPPPAPVAAPEPPPPPPPAPEPAPVEQKKCQGDCPNP